VVAVVSVDHDRRGVLAVVHVAGAGRKRWSPLYRGIERIEAPRLRTQLSEGYGTVVVRAGESVTSDSFVADVAALVARPDLDVVDVVLTTHGDPGEVIFTREDRVAIDALAARIAHPKLRFAYNTACYGRTHAEALRSAGFRTVVGAKAKNTNGWAEYHHLLRRWMDGATVAEAVKAADRVVPRMFWDLVARTVGRMRDVDSEKVVTGNAALRITDAV
jgi:hypothetical protein